MTRRTTGAYRGAEPRPGRWRRTVMLATIVVVPLLVAGCATGDEAATNGDDASPAPSPSPAMQGSTGSESPSPNGDSEQELSTTVDELVDEAVEMRGLEPQSDIDAQLVDSQRMGEIAGEVAERNADQRVIDTDVLAALRFVPQGTDLPQLSQEAGSALFGGMYDPGSQNLYVLADDGSLGPLERANTVHEIVHALQDQHYDLERRFPAESGADAAVALKYLMEGDAQWTQQQWTGTELSQQQRQQLMQRSRQQLHERQQDLAQLPQAFVLGSMLQYPIGAEFVQVVQEAEGSGAVAAAYRDPPDTAVEIFDPQLYLEGFEPSEVSELASPGSPWNASTSVPFSAHHIALMQSTPSQATQALQGQLPVASQWRGGQMRVWRADDQLVVGMSTTFAGDGASAFCERVESWYREQAQAQPAGDNALESDRDAMAVECGQGDVRFAIAPTVEDARAVVGG